MFNFFSKSNKQQPSTSKEVLGALESLEEKCAELSHEVRQLQEKIGKAITKVGLVRYNPFEEVGGDQSFSIALLNENDDGFVITAHFWRDHNRTYAKPIKQRISEYALSEEEKEAIRLACGEKK